LDQLAAEHGVALVCVQPLLVARAREGEDFTRNKNDNTDATVIARLVTELRCYLPERADPAWARLRHLGARRARLITARTAARLQARDLLECVWPAVLQAAGSPLKTANWLAAVTVALDWITAGPELGGGELDELGRRGFDAFAGAVRAQLGGTRWYPPIVRAVFAAATDPAQARVGVFGQRAGALERVQFTLADVAHLDGEIARVETRMVGVLDQLELTELVSSIPGVSAVGAAAILAESGDPTRFGSARGLVKHAGLCPRDNESGHYAGKTTISGRGRPGLRLAAWRVLGAAVRHNPVLAARHAHLTGRAERPLTDTQARVAVAASLLRQLHAVIITRTAWNPAIAAGLDRAERAAEHAGAAA
jgi:transposase